MASTADVSYRSTAQATNGATPHGVANGYHHLSNGSVAAASSYQAKKQGAPLMRHEGGGWLTANFVKLSICTAAGVVFGFAAEKAKGMKDIDKFVIYSYSCRQCKAFCDP